MTSDGNFKHALIIEQLIERTGTTSSAIACLANPSESRPIGSGKIFRTAL